MSGPSDDERVASGDGSHDGGSNDPTYRWGGVGGATRRSVLGSLAGAFVTMGLSGQTTALDSAPGTTTVPGTSEDIPWQGSLRGHWRQEATVGPTSGHCPPETLSQEWQSTALADGVSGLLIERGADSPVYVSGVDLASLSTEGNIYALDRDTGEILSGWPIETSGTPFLTPGGDLLYYAVAAAGQIGPIPVYGVDARTGESVWNTVVPPSSQGISLQYDPSADVLYTVSSQLTDEVGNPPGQLTVTALDGSSGSEVWQSQLSQGEVVTFTRRDGSTLYIPSTSIDTNAGGVDAAHLRAVDLRSGVGDRERWSVSKDGLTVSGLPVVYQDFVVASFGPPNREPDRETLLVALNEADGTERWSKTRSDDLVWFGGFFTSNGSGLYASAGRGVENGSSEGVLTRLNPNNGDTEWEYDLGGIIGGFQAEENRTYTASIEGDVAAIDDDPDSAGYGQEIWSETLASASDDGIGGGLFLRCGRLYTATTENPGVAYVLDPADGSTLDTFTVDSGVIRSHWVVDGSVWAATGTDPDEGVTTTADENRVYRLDDGSEDPPAAQASVGLDPASGSVTPDGQRSFDVLVEGAENGVGSYEMVVEVGDAGVASIADVSPTKNPASAQIDIASDGSSADVSVDMGGNGYDPGDATVADLTIEGEGTGSTTLSLSNVALRDTEDATYDVTDVGGASVTVTDDSGPSPIVGEDPPQDLDGDGLYEDIDGDGEFTIRDVQLFFQNRDADAVQNNAQFFNFDGQEPPEVSIGDVQALFQLFQEQE